MGALNAICWSKSSFWAFKQVFLSFLSQTGFLGERTADLAELDPFLKKPENNMDVWTRSYGLTVYGFSQGRDGVRIYPGR